MIWAVRIRQYVYFSVYSETATADEIAAFRSGKVQMLYPQPLPDFASLKGLPKTWLLIRGRQRIVQHPFNETLLKGDFQLSLSSYSLATADPGLCAALCSESIPRADNGYFGGNRPRIANIRVDIVLGELDNETDGARRVQLHAQGEQLLADSAASLPLVALPDVIVTDTATVGGPVGHNPHCLRAVLQHERVVRVGLTA